MTIIVFYKKKKICETSNYYWIQEYLEDAIYMKEIKIEVKKEEEKNE